ncbi:MAG: PfkB family carbohydrate kinase, partial [Planctomycetota bacterium]
YDIALDSAWDNLPWSDALAQLAAVTQAVCFGSLGQRSPASADTIRRFVSHTPIGALRVFDINIRPPFHTDDVILDSLDTANLLKLSDEEWPVLAQLCGFEGEERDVARQIAERFGLQLIALTRGSEGATLYQGDRVSHTPGMPTEVADTVGAGDSYTASLVLGLLRGHDLDDINRHACRVAAYVCSQNGATPSIPEELR